MPRIRVTYNPGTSNQKEAWAEIQEPAISKKDGKLHTFRLIYENGNHADLHLYESHSLVETAETLFAVGTTSRSAKGLLEDFSKIAGYEHLAGKAGYAGILAGGAIGIHKFLQSRPRAKVGYYDGAENLILARVINARNPNDYNPA